MFVYRFLLKDTDVLINISLPPLMSMGMTMMKMKMMMIMMMIMITVTLGIHNVKVKGTQQTVTYLLSVLQMLGLNLYLQEENYIL
jgi:hypothetical protein